MLKVHIVSHTHWDREWYLSSDYTNKWLVPFFEKLFSLLKSNKNYKFVLDGQMQMVYDYLGQLSANEREEKRFLLQKYGKEKRIFFGPYWAQIDLRIPGPESIVRNILIGYKYAKKFGNLMKVGWLLDNFGLVGQMPQIHKLTGMEAVFIWRGVEFPNDELASEFLWESPDGTKVMASYFFNSYRNLMGLTAYQEIASHRVKNEVEKMRPFLVSPNLLLMNGYDLDTYPEDPFSVIKEDECKNFTLLQSSPIEYASDVRKSVSRFSSLKGELLSGRYSGVFPATLSSRTYLKIWNYLCEYVLAKLIEPISAIVWHFTGYHLQNEVEKLWKDLIVNEIHDNISGVCIDQVHIQMEARYARLMSESKKVLYNLLSHICGKFPKDSIVVFNTNPFSVTLPLEVNGRILMLRDIPPLGYKVIRELEAHRISNLNEEIEDFFWENDFYSASINPDGTLDIYGKSSDAWYKGVGYFYDEGDAGDEYNYSPPPEDEIFTTRSSTAKCSLLYRNSVAAKISVETQLNVPKELQENKRSKETTTLKMRYEVLFDTTPLIKFHILLRNTARDHRLKMAFPTNIKNGKIVAEMPFEYVERPSYLDNSRPIPQKLLRIFIGARECGKEYTFPMKDFVAITNDSQIFSVMTRGISEYEVRGKTIFVTLLRAIGWIARSDLKLRHGDAGPLMYTPEAQCLRETECEIAVFLSKGGVQDSAITKWAQVFHNPPMVVKINEGSGRDTDEFSLGSMENSNLKLTALKIAENGDGIVVRFFNPYDKTISLKLPGDNWKCFKTDLLENPIEEISNVIEIVPHEIVTLKFNITSFNEKYQIPVFDLLTPELKLPENKRITDDVVKPEKLKLLEDKIKQLSNHLTELKSTIKKRKGLAYHEAMFDFYRSKRTYLEAKISLLLNKERVAKDGDERIKLVKEIEKVGIQLNDTRIKRRAYEYILDYWKAVL